MDEPIFFEAMILSEAPWARGVEDGSMRWRRSPSIEVSEVVVSIAACKGFEEEVEGEVWGVEVRAYFLEGMGCCKPKCLVISTRLELDVPKARSCRARHW